MDKERNTLTDSGTQSFGAARSKLVSARDKVADGIRATADTLDDRASRAAGEHDGIAEFEHSAADKLHSWSDSLRDWDVEAAEAKIRSTVMRRPGVSLLAAAGVGLCIGLWLRKS